ncbi:CG9505 [Drosophila busckii]|uniref:CG9505 n=2 Tax=Drosophila busckii TaxID=30019 RepID=A0A0M4EQL0_DROBS|nr:CG9505 [Drosophila busckii]
MRPEADACENFHDYACGNWHKQHGGNVSQMSLSGARIEQRYVQLFEQLLQVPQTELIYEKLLRYYNSCRTLGKQNLKRYLQRLPATESNHWLELLALMGRYGYRGHYVQLSVSQQNATHHMLLLQLHNYNLSLKLSRRIYDVLSRMSRHHKLPSQAQLAQQFAQLEQRLSNVSNVTDNDTDTLNTMSLAELQQQVPIVNWTQALHWQFGTWYAPEHQLVVDNVTALHELIDVLNNANPRLLQLYSRARFLQYLLQLPHNPLGEHSAESCVRHMRKTLYLAMNYAYEQSYYAKQRPDDEQIIFAVFEQLKAQFSLQLQRNEFGLSDELLAALQQKVRGVRLNVGNMPPQATAAFYQECIEHWQVGDNFYDNHLHSLQHYYSHLAELERSVNETERQLWYSFNHHAPDLLDNIDATPYFYCLGSIIIMPYAYVQLPFYHAQFWPALLYGDLANTLGHEMLHAFDTYFVDYDAQGVMRNYSDQLNQHAEYVQRVSCLNDSQVIMLNERVADISGTRLALQTYMQQPLNRRHNGRLYFLQFAQFFCGEEADMFHDTGSKRLNYALAQMQEFAEAFDCAPGSAMNPPQRCSFW